MIKELSKNIAYGLMLICLICLSAQAKDPTIIALFGDSNSLGFNKSFENIDRDGDERENYGEPSIRLSHLLNDSKRPSKVINASYGGSASGPSRVIPFNGRPNGLDRINADLSSVKSKFTGRAYYALIMYGINDLEARISPSTTGFNNKEMIRKANNLGFTVLVSTILPCDTCDTRAGQIYKVSQINSYIYKAFKESKALGSDVYFSDNHAAVRADWNNGLVDPDGVHPTNEGYEAIARNWFTSHLERLIEQDPNDITPIINLLLDE